jgi:hypothetical protein
VSRLVRGVARRVAAGALRLDPRLHWARGSAWVQGALGARSYRALSEAELRATRRSDTIFVFGSGYSINDLSSEEWEAFAEHDTLSFNWFPHQRWVRIDYHLIREVATDDLRRSLWRPALERYGKLIRDNPHYADTVFLVQGGWRATNGNRLVGLRLLPLGARVFRFGNRARNDYAPPSESFSEGLVHAAMTLGDCVNFAYLLGWKRIVLVGVDMYDHRYFWLERDAERADIGLPRRRLTVDDPFAGAATVIHTLGVWHALFAARGVTLEVYNPKSLLAEVLPVHPALGGR